MEVAEWRSGGVAERANTPSMSRRAAASTDEQEMFAAALSRAKEGGTPATRAREAAEGLVATALIYPVLKQMRESNRAAPPFAPGRGERSFGQLMDATLAQRVVKSAHWPLVDALARRMLARMGATP